MGQHDMYTLWTDVITARDFNIVWHFSSNPKNVSKMPNDEKS